MHSLDPLVVYEHEEVPLLPVSKDLRLAFQVLRCNSGWSINNPQHLLQYAKMHINPSVFPLTLCLEASQIANLLCKKRIPPNPSLHAQIIKLQITLTVKYEKDSRNGIEHTISAEYRAMILKLITTNHRNHAEGTACNPFKI